MVGKLEELFADNSTYRCHCYKDTEKAMSASRVQGGFIHERGWEVVKRVWNMIPKQKVQC